MFIPGLIRGRVARGILSVTLCLGIGCQRTGQHYVAPEEPLPANTVLLAQMMRELSGRPGFTETVLAQINQGDKRGAAFLTPALVDELRKMVLGQDWQGLDRFPGWTMQAINPTVRVVGHVAGREDEVEDLAARHPGAPAGALRGKGYVDLGPYALDKAETVDLEEPSRLPGFTTKGIVSDLGAGVVRGDGANAALAPEHAESQRLADVLNRLGLNGEDGVASFRVLRSLDAMTSGATGRSGGMDKRKDFSSSPEDLILDLQASGHTVEVYDARYFANFGHFHFKGQDVMMPFWVNSKIEIPGTKTVFKRARPLLVPVSHAEYEWHVRGPKINADVSWYFGIDGKAEFRTMDTLDQAWVMGRHAHTYTDEDAVEVTRLVGRMEVAYVHQHVARPELPFGGYYALGVCQDSVAAIEKRMTGQVTLFPNTADAALFDDARDAEVNQLMAAVPKDREGEPPEPERIFGSLPVDDPTEVSIPGLGADLAAVESAWHGGYLRRTREPRTVIALEVLGVVLAAGTAVWLLARRRKTPYMVGERRW